MSGKKRILDNLDDESSDEDQGQAQVPVVPSPKRAMLSSSRAASSSGSASSSSSETGAVSADSGVVVSADLTTSMMLVTNFDSKEQEEDFAFLKANPFPDFANFSAEFDDDPEESWAHMCGPNHGPGPNDNLRVINQSERMKQLVAWDLLLNEDMKTRDERPNDGCLDKTARVYKNVTAHMEKLSRWVVEAEMLLSQGRAVSGRLTQDQQNELVGRVAKLTEFLKDHGLVHEENREWHDAGVNPDAISVSLDRMRAVLGPKLDGSEPTWAALRLFRWRNATVAIGQKLPYSSEALGVLDAFYDPLDPECVRRLKRATAKK